MDFQKEWTPVEVSVQETRAEIRVIGRTYLFERSVLPVSILAEGKELLQKPMELIPFFKEESGTWDEVSYLLVESTEEKAVFLISAHCRNVMINLTVTCEFDGFMQFEMRLLPDWSLSGDRVPSLTGFRLRVELKEEDATLFHYWPNTASCFSPNPNIVNSGKNIDRDLPWKPYFWMGSERRGLGLFLGESDEFIPKKEDCLRIRGNVTELDLLDGMADDWKGRTDEWGNALNPICYTIGFQATPVKKHLRTPEDYRRLHINVSFDGTETKPMYSIADKAAEAGVRWLILHESWSQIQNYGKPGKEEQFREYVEYCHKKNMKIMVYFGYEYASLAPDFGRKWKDYLIFNAKGNCVGGWQRKPDQRDYMVCYKGGYGDAMIQRVIYAMDELHVDGIYTDGTYEPVECSNPNHGCGYTDSQGNRHTTFPVLAVREFVKKLYQAVHERGGIIDTHQSSCAVMTTLAFCDTYFDGESHQHLLQDEDMTHLDQDAFRAEYMGSTYGLSSNLICMPKPPVRTVNGLQSMSLLHNTHTRPYSVEDMQYIRPYWDLFDRYRFNEAKWYCYTENPYARTDAKQAFTSAYEIEGKKYLYCVTFLKADSVEFRLTVKGRALRDLITDKEYTVSDGTVSLPLKQSRPYFYEIIE